VQEGGLFVIEKGEVGVGPLMDELKGVGSYTVRNFETFILHRVL
jgi:hypothetical protein